PLGTGVLPYFNNSPILLQADGSYTLRIDDFYDVDVDDFGTFKVFLDWLSPRSSQCGQRLTCGDVASGQLEAPYDDDFFHFDGEAGDVVHIEAITDEGTVLWTAHMDVYQPDSTAKVGLNAEANLTLPTSGTYTIRIQTNASGFGKYRVRIVWLKPSTKACGS